jgi:hypothetical protein
MLILDKQKAVERMVALSSGEDVAGWNQPDDEPSSAHRHARTYQRIATYERRAAATLPLRRLERRKRRLRLLEGPSPA